MKDFWNEVKHDWFFWSYVFAIVFTAIIIAFF